MTRTSLAGGRITSQPGELDTVYDRPAYPGRSTRAVIFCHGSGGSALLNTTTAETHDLMRGLAQSYRTVSGDFAGDAWANDVSLTRVHEAVTWLQATGTTGKVALVGGSMGAATALAYALAHPENVACVAGIIPLTDIADIMTRGASTSVNAAYGGTYSDTTHGPTHSPVKFATTLDAALPVRLWTASDDPLCVPATAAAFVASRPQTVRTDLGAVGHTMAAVAASTAGVVSWVGQQLG